MSVEDYIRNRSLRKKDKTNEHGHLVWKKVSCPYCQKKVEYLPKQGWNGNLRCPYCEKVFVVPSLDRFFMCEPKGF